MNQTGPTRNRKALLVIDIQEDYTGSAARPPFPYHNSKQLIDTVNKIIAKAASKNVAVVYIRQEFDGVLGKAVSKIIAGGTAIKGNTGTEIDKRVNIINGNIFTKPMPDAFSNPKLEKFLQAHQVGELILTGLDAEFCVYATAKGAVKRGYKVSIVRDAIALKVEKKWDLILSKYKRKRIMLISSETAI